MKSPPTHNLERIGFVSTRIGGTDGVSLEIEKWATTFERMGSKCFYIAGQSDRPPDRSFLIETAHFDHPEIREIDRRCFGRTRRTRQVTKLIRQHMIQIKDKLYEARDHFDLQAIIAENALAIPMNIPLGLAIVEFVIETGLPCIAHHHDFAWERERYLVNAAPDLMANAFPPPLPDIDHVVINSLASMEFARRTGLGCDVIPNIMDYANPPAPADEYALSFREAIGLKPEDKMILQPTRIIPRKNIEAAIELVHRMRDPRCKLVITHLGGDEGDAYVQHVIQYAELLDVPLILAGAHIAEHRSLSPEGKRLYTLWDAYPCADLVAYPSTYEGFGNALLEAVYFRRPIMCNRYAIFRTDIEPCGFGAVIMDGFVTKDVVENTKNLLDGPNRVQRMVETNYEVARKFFSYEYAEKLFQQIRDRTEHRPLEPDEPNYVAN